MESSATFSAAARLDMHRVALLHAWDDLLASRAATETALFDLALQPCLEPTDAHP